MSILEKLYNGEYYPAENDIPDTDEYRELIHQLSAASEQLEKCLSDEQLALFHKYCDLKNQCELLSGRKMYADAVRFGAELILEIAYPDIKPNRLPDQG